AIANLAGAYEGLLRRRSAVDYTAMLVLPLRLFQGRPAALRLYQDAYRHVLCDEGQDICASQYRLLRLLAERHQNLVIVGDPCQQLYGWRGADVRHFLGFQQDFPEARVFGLDQNFRATGRLVALANAFGASLSDGRQLWTPNPPGQPALLYLAPNEAAEATFVAVETGRLLAERQIEHPGEVAILYRTAAQSVELTLALRARHLPYRV